MSKSYTGKPVARALAEVAVTALKDAEDIDNGYWFEVDVATRGIPLGKFKFIVKRIKPNA